MPSNRDHDSGGGLIFKIGIIIMVVLFVVFFAGSFITVVPAGTIGVKDTFGVVDQNEFPSGIHIKNPFTRVVVMSTRTQPYVEPDSGDTITLDVLSNEGLKVAVGYTVLYRIVPERADELYRTVGENYPLIIMRTPIHAVPRDIISRYDAKTLYSANTLDNPDRLKIEQSIQDEIIRRINHDSDGNYIDRGIVIEQIGLRNIQLPQVVTDSIEAKLSMEQQIAQKKFEVNKEVEEANRKVAEASGIARSNQIISNSLTPEYLKWYWLQNLQNHQSTAYLQLGDDGFPMALTKDV